jgi:formylglycine-generating enzyme required for sulfatase activity
MHTGALSCAEHLQTAFSKKPLGKCLPIFAFLKKILPFACFFGISFKYCEPFHPLFRILNTFSSAIGTLQKHIDRSMKNASLKFSALALLALAATGCGPSGTGGQLVGSPNTLAYRAPTPLGMSYVPSGILRMGASDEDVSGRNDNMVRTAQMTGFYMDATEVSNAEYRQFTNWVRDSIAHTTLGDFIDNPDGTQRVDLRRPINFRDEDVRSQLAGMYTPADQSGYGREEMDMSKMIYRYTKFDYDDATRSPGQPASNFVRTTEIPVYPDTLVWTRQFAYGSNEPIAQQYNWFPAFNNYPVVGVNWNQASAFCNWRTQSWKGERERTRQFFEGNFQLPSEYQWEWAARGGRNQTPYPWGGPFLLNKKGCYLANFKPLRGNYAADGGLYTVAVDRYYPNDYGLYNMAGNVSEWTSSTYFGNAYQVVADVNPEINYKIRESDPQWMRRKVVRGGSWRDVAYYLQNGTRDWEFADTSKAYIGFRCTYQQIAPALTNRR